MGGINIGLPSDRLYVEWWVTSNRVKSRVSQNRGPLTLAQYLGGRAVIVNECDRDENSQPVLPEEFLQLDSSLILVEIPDDIQHLKSIDVPLSIRWRSHIRHVFDHYFNRQYLVTDFVRSVDQAGANRSYYVLTQADG
jgi:predicted GNAT superfamily acetyltransferase